MRSRPVFPEITVRTDHVLVVAVMHERQHPDYWRTRVNTDR